MVTPTWWSWSILTMMLYIDSIMCITFIYIRKITGQELKLIYIWLLSQYRSTVILLQL